VHVIGEKTDFQTLLFPLLFSPAAPEYSPGEIGMTGGRQVIQACTQTAYHMHKPLRHGVRGEEIAFMMTQARHVENRSGWCSALAGGLLATLLLMAAYAPALHPATATRKAYVGLFKDSTVAVLDTSTNRVLSTISIPPGPHGLAITPDGRKVYVSSDGASTVSVIDTVTDQVVASIDVGPTPHGLAISPDGRQVLVSGFGSNQVVIIDTTNDQVVGRMPVPQPHNSAISPDGRTAYVGSQQQGATALVILNLASRTQLGTVPLDKTPRALDVSPDGQRLYITVAGVDAVQVFDPSTRRVVGQIPVGASPHHPLFTPHGQFGLVVSQGPGELALLDPSSDTVSGSVPVGKAPHWIAVSSDGRTAYVTNEASNDVSVVDLASRRVTATIPVGNAPRKIVVQADSARPAAGAVPAPAAAATTPTTAVQPPGQPIKLGELTFADHGTKDVKGQTELELEADDYYFAPTFLRGTPGQTLTLEIENESGTLHNLSIPALHLDKDIPPKGKVHVQVTMPQSGAVHFFCKFHTAMGMNGELLAGDATPQPVFQGTTAKTK
jgi:YVTN family beta-propeller protein